MDKGDIHTTCLEHIPRDNLFTTLLLNFQLLLHNPIETPKIADFGSLIAPGKEYRIKITPTISNSSKSLRSVKKSERQCAYSADRYLRFYRTYTQNHCSLECEANFTYSVCNCVPVYLPSTCAQTLYSSLFSSFHFRLSLSSGFIYLRLPFVSFPFVSIPPFLKPRKNIQLKKQTLIFQLHTWYEKQICECVSRSRLMISCPLSAQFGQYHNFCTGSVMSQ
jgi:hypothetical protein